MKRDRQKDEAAGLDPEVLLSEVARRLTVCLLCILLLAVPAFADNHDKKNAEELEYEVKAAFIYNFMKFIQWPGAKHIAASDSPRDKPVKIAVIGQHPYKKTFQLILDKTVQGRPVEMVAIQSLEEFREAYADRRSALDAYSDLYRARLAECHLLFICASEKNCFADLLTLTVGGAVVTVSDLPDFAAENGMIGFVREKTKIRFEVNLDAVQKENIKISSQLLGLAKRVYKK